MIVWLIYKILEEESKKVMTDLVIESLLPMEINVFFNTSINFIENKISNINGII